MAEGKLEILGATLGASSGTEVIPYDPMLMASLAKAM